MLIPFIIFIGDLGACGVWGPLHGGRMNIYIALFRGINVGGNNSMLMKELVAILLPVQPAIPTSGLALPVYVRRASDPAASVPPGKIG